MMAKKPTLAVFKFASCDGCQLSLLSAEDELLAVADAAAFFAGLVCLTLSSVFDGTLAATLQTEGTAGDGTHHTDA